MASLKSYVQKIKKKGKLRGSLFQKDRSSEGKSSSLSTKNESEDIELSFRRILNLLKEKTQVDLSQYKLTTVRRRIQRQMMLSKMENMEAYASHLRSHPQALQELFDALFIHVTEFFRDLSAYQALCSTVFSKLVKNRKPEETLRVWVPGCSTGEEIYSIGMALVEFLNKKNLQIKFQIFGTDISEQAIQRARKATYSRDQVKSLGEARLNRFFEKTFEGYKIKKFLRETCVISRHDVTTNPPFTKLDLVSCRNVLIYFEPDLQKRVIPVFHYALKRDGFLWLGKSETPGASSKLFSVIDKKNKIYSKVEESVSNRLHLLTQQMTLGNLYFPKTVEEQTFGQDVQRNADQMMIFRYAPPGVILNSNMDIVQFRGRTAPFLEPAPGQPSNNLLKMAQPSLRAILKPLFQSAKKQNQTVRKEGLTVICQEEQKKINIEVSPLNPLAPEKTRNFLMIFEEVGTENQFQTEKHKGVQKKRRALSEPTPAKDHLIEQLQQEIESLKDYQQTLSEQFQSAQEELTSANEELQATNEELQSTNEELETAKEELQSANEELMTMNDELQGRNLELISVNEKLRRGEDRFRLMVESVKDYAIFMLDPEGKVASWNEGARRFKGYEASEIIGQHFSKFYSEVDIKAGKPARELEQARIEGRLEDEGWRLRKDGSRFWANVVVTRINDQSGKLIGFSKVTRDLTERRRNEDDLRLSEERFRLLVSAVRDYAIFMLDPEGRVASWNEGARRIKGYEASEIIGQHFSKFYLPSDIQRNHPANELKIAIKEGKYGEEGWRLRKDGSHFWANVLITRINDKNGNLLGFSKVTRDLTERKIVEEKLKAAHDSLEKRVQQRTKDLELALNTRDEFLSIASHELKTPLTSLKLQLQIMRRRLKPEENIAPSPKELAGALDLGVKQANALSDLVEDLLDVSRIQTGKLVLSLDKVNLTEVVRDVVTRFSQQLASAGCLVELKLQNGVQGEWDKRRLEQVVMNLISNAIKYAPGGPIYISTISDGDKVFLMVKDSGPGVDKNQHSRIFERFERASPDRHIGGLGLGLFIVRRIVEAHQGNIRIESDLGKGAQFIVELPMSFEENTKVD